MAVNKIQDQTFDTKSLYVDQNKLISGHDQLYIAISRCHSKHGIKVQIVCAKNVVVKEML